MMLSKLCLLSMQTMLWTVGLWVKIDFGGVEFSIHWSSIMLIGSPSGGDMTSWDDPSPTQSKSNAIRALFLVGLKTWLLLTIVHVEKIILTPSPKLWKIRDPLI